MLWFPALVFGAVLNDQPPHYKKAPFATVCGSWNRPKKDNKFEQKVKGMALLTSWLIDKTFTPLRKKSVRNCWLSFAKLLSLTVCEITFRHKSLLPLLDDSESWKQFAPLGVSLSGSTAELLSWRGRIGDPRKEIPNSKLFFLGGKKHIMTSSVSHMCCLCHS